MAIDEQESVDGDDDDDVISEEAPVIGFWSGIAWLVGMTAIIALLSEYLARTIEVTISIQLLISPRKH